MNYRDIEKLKLVLGYIVLIIAVLLTIAPVVWIITTSFKPSLLTFSIPPRLLFKPTMESYRMLLLEGHHAFGVNIWRDAKNSLIIAITTTFMCIILGVLAAYGFSRFKFAGKRALGFFILATRMLPPIGTTIPMFLLMLKLGLLDTRTGLSMAHLALNIPFAVWMLRGFMDEIPSDLDEAAMIDGCTRIGAVFRVILPLIAPGVVATAVFSFLLSWNDFALALVLTGRNARTLPLIVMSFMTEEGIYWGPMAAAATLIIIPPIIFIIFAQKWIARGLTLGAVKG